MTTALAYLAAVLGVMAALGVLAFHFPEFLTTPQLRDLYTEDQVRLLLRGGLMVATATGVLALLIGRNRAIPGRGRRVALFGLTCSLLAWIAGGADVPLDGPVRTARFYISLDWLLLDLLLIATLFISLERFRRLVPEQGILRSGWRVDLTHYVVSHLANGGLVYLIFLPATVLREGLDLAAVQQAVSSWPLLVQVLAIMVVTDFAQYWCHRASHRIPLLWRFHSVHHSVEAMDWLAGSRLHLVDILVTRAGSLVPMVLLGFSNEAINIYLPILALQSVFIHCNVNYPLGALRKILATPQFHHWHHTRDLAFADRNFSVTFPVFDILFGTYHCPPGQWPSAYGLQNSPFDGRYLTHVLQPFGLRRSVQPEPAD